LKISYFLFADAADRRRHFAGAAAAGKKTPGAPPSTRSDPHSLSLTVIYLAIHS